MTREKWCKMFVARVHSRMEYMNMTRAEFTAKVGVNDNKVSRWFRCETVPKAIDIVNISKVLNCSVSWLIDFGDRIEKGDGNE